MILIEGRPRHRYKVSLCTALRVCVCVCVCDIYSLCTVGRTTRDMIEQSLSLASGSTSKVRTLEM